MANTVGNNEPMDINELQEDEASKGNSELTASEESESNWISWFTSLHGNDFFCDIDEDYIHDDFNLTGLNSMVPYYDHALDLILEVDIPLDTLSEEQQEIVESAAEVLYGLIHARFILTTRGMQKMFDKYKAVQFGRCPRVFCQGQPVLPISLSDVPRNVSVSVFCPRCQDVFYPKGTKCSLDGAYFGTTFAHLFLLSHSEVLPKKAPQAYSPRIYGFKINRDSPYYKQREKVDKGDKDT